MKRFLLSFVLLFFTFNTLFAQKDTEHWIAPYFVNTSVGSFTNTLYVSSDSTTPFDVKVYSNDANGVQTLLTTLSVSKNNPKTYTVAASAIYTTSTSEAGVPVQKGLYLQGTKSFFCSLRAAQGSHGEIVTSKGKAGIGTKFYAAAAPITYSSSTLMDFTTGVMATENGTTVTVTGYDPNITFINNSNTSGTLTFNLEKGQSYLIAGIGDNTANNTGFIGAKITSNKPITITNGNANAMYATGSLTSGSDLVLDQSVPTERLGNEFAMVRSLSPTNSYDMEGGIIIATENNTEVYLNNALLPVITLNEGDYYRILDNSYINQGNGHYNIYVRTTKNVYLYQLVGSTSTATGGYNYIPPLNCFLPRKIDEIGKINEMPGSSGAITLKLNILTEAGATVTYTLTPAGGVPGAPITPTAAQGPYPLSGNANWVTYAIEGVTGNLAIQSNKAVTAGINGGYSSAGYGGYFAGFSSVPVISKQTGECAPGIILEVEAGFDSYQWYLNGTLIPGATSNTYAPLVGGNYTVRVTMGGCQPVVTLAYKVFSCLKQTSKSDETCGTKIIQPTFTSSTQTPVANTVTIITPPANGTAVVNTNGTITYTPNTGFAGSDVLVYKFCGNAPEFIDCEQVTHTIKIVPLVGKEPTITACQYDTDPTALFDLTTANVTDYPSPTTKKYYSTLNDLNTNSNEIAEPKKYASAGGYVYVRINADGGCTGTAKIKLVTIPVKKSAILVDKYICIDDRTSLDAGTGYNSYQWSTGATTSSIQGVPVGEYTVILEQNGCFLKQTVHVKKAQDPVITKIEITNNTATVIVSGGVAPYKYSVDGTTAWKDSNVFTNLSRGQHTFYVKDAYNCTPISVEVTVPNLINAITPNGDNVNDYIDYSELAYKENLTFVIYDRYGNKIFTGDKFNDYRWDGKGSGKKVVTGTYWYHINWNEPNAAKTPIKYSGWILVKNRE
ncbi:T9SS type B sorting domain-containing protein [Chryseobacterium sp. RG1]|uniref:T9SS type B sorting domain-containing protein n=1 Tax=Chryseobacterium tagetis TaxID=2801334 RepID=A0ABS8A719_9FLAO|nr:T9SS type B sorting domain-containing protein [Chryseobacterium tagetis]MCA6069272.1 T9SS type B sorting domain-containing protein [Chryseobacterium tagetis]